MELCLHCIIPLLGCCHSAKNFIVAPWSGEDILSASSNESQVQAQTSFISLETSFETAVQYSVTVAAISGWMQIPWSVEMATCKVVNLP